MAQFALLSKWYLQNNSQYQTLMSKLINNKNECLKTNNNHIGFCSKDQNDFKQYLKIYTRQTVDKGHAICRQLIASETNKNPQQLIDECITLYSMNIQIFQKNAIDKLRSLTQKFNVEQL